MRRARPRRRRTTSLAALGLGGVALAVLLFGPAAPSRADEASALDILEKIGHSDALGLEAWIEGDHDGKVRVGDSIRFRFKSAADVYLTTVYVDASGALTILHSGGDADRLAAGQTLTFPPEGSNQQMIAQTPLGKESVVAIATREPLPQDMFVDESQKRVVNIERPADARHFARRLADYVSVMPEGSVDVAWFSHEVVPSGAPRRYTEVQIVDHFTTQTRSLRRRKLDLDIPFAFGSDQLTDEARRDLDEVGRALEHPSMKERRFELAGHTDDVGSEAYNMDLSKRRAESARRYLLSHYDVDPSRLEAKGYGEEQPEMPGTSPEARQANRRVVIEQLP